MPSNRAALAPTGNLNRNDLSLLILIFDSIRRMAGLIKGNAAKIHQESDSLQDDLTRLRTQARTALSTADFGEPPNRGNSLLIDIGSTCTRGAFGYNQFDWVVRDPESRTYDLGGGLLSGYHLPELDSGTFASRWRDVARNRSIRGHKRARSRSGTGPSRPRNDGDPPRGRAGVAGQSPLAECRSSWCSNSYRPPLRRTVSMGTPPS